MRLAEDKINSENLLK